MIFRTGLTLACWAIFSVCAVAQPDVSIYKGLRISLFGVSIKKQKQERLSVILSVANTGRLPVSFGKKTDPPPENLVIELDTVNLPIVLQGRESLLSDAIRKEKISLMPGDIMTDVSVEVELKEPETTEIVPEGDSINPRVCADLAFDTAFIVQYTEDKMLLRFVLRNTGDAPARLLGKSDRPDDNLAVNVYFVSGQKLTRGAILADGIFVEKGRETLDGVLLPGQILQGDIEIDLARRNKFSPNLVFELDPFQTVTDCKRGNNTKAVLVEF